MVSKKYDPVPNDETDTRVPIHPDEAFQHGIAFPAKYIGTLDVPRPTSRVEIVAAMRKIRYEFKAKGIKKKKVTLDVSVDGVCVNLRKKKKKKNNFPEEKITLMHHPIYRIFYVSHDSQDLKIFSYIAREGASNNFKCNVFKSTKKGSRSSLDGDCEKPRKRLSFREPMIMGTSTTQDHTPKGGTSGQPRRGKLERSAVSYDEERLRHIKRHGEVVVNDSGLTPPLPFAEKSEKNSVADREWLRRRISEEDEEELESQAMKIVRTVGQAFEVCHKLSLNTGSPQNEGDDPLNDLEAASEKDSDALSDPLRKDGFSDLLGEEDSVSNVETADPFERTSPKIQGKHQLYVDLIASPTAKAATSTAEDPLLDLTMDETDLPELGTGLSAQHEIQLLREQLEQQCQQTQAAVAQVHLLRDQLAAETTARIEAQARTHQLLVHNKELLDHITALVAHLQDKEGSKTKSGNHFSIIPQLYSDPTSTMDSQDPSDNRQSGTFVTAPSSPKQRHAPFYAPPQPTPQQMGSLYSLAFPTPSEQQFQAQLLQRLTSLQYASPPLLTPPPTLYHTLPYNFCPFPHQTELPPRLDPPPPPRKVADHPPKAKSPIPLSGPKSPSPSSRPMSPKSSSYLASALSSINRLRVGVEKTNVTGKKSVQVNGPGPITRATSEKVPNRSELMEQLSPSAKVFRWFKLLQQQPQSTSLSRPESGFLDGDKSQKDEEDVIATAEGEAKDDNDDGELEEEASQLLLRSNSSCKKGSSKRFKYHLGRMTTTF